MSKRLRGFIVALAVLAIFVFSTGCGARSSTDNEKAFGPSTYAEAYWNGFDVGFTQSYSEFYGNNNDEDYMGMPPDLEEWLADGIGLHLTYVADERTPETVVQGAKDGFLDGFELGWEIWKEGKTIRSWGKGSRFQGN